jgi:hypothetical protein
MLAKIRSAVCLAGVEGRHALARANRQDCVPRGFEDLYLDARPDSCLGLLRCSELGRGSLDASGKLLQRVRRWDPGPLLTRWLFRRCGTQTRSRWSEQTGSSIHSRAKRCTRSPSGQSSPAPLHCDVTTFVSEMA